MIENQGIDNVAAERRFRMFKIYRIMWAILVLLEILFAFRFILRLIAANPNSGFAMVIYGITGIFVGPFNGLISMGTSGGSGSTLEITTLIAMAVYALIFWGIAYGFRLVLDLNTRPITRNDI